MTYLVMGYNGKYWYTIKEITRLKDALVYAEELFLKLQTPIQIIDHEGNKIKEFN